MAISKSKIYALCSIIVLIVSMVYIVYSVTPNTFYISNGVYSGNTNYIVWVESGYYYAKNSYGLIVFSGNNASIILQNVFDSVVSTTSTIYLKNGTYNLGNMGISTSKSIRLIGEGTLGTLLIYTGSGYAVILSGINSAVERISFSGYPYQTAKLLKIDNSFIHVDYNDFYSFNIAITVSGDTNYNSYSLIENNRIASGHIGIYANTSSTYVTDLTIRKNLISVSDVCVYDDSAVFSTSHWVFDNNDFASATGTAIKLGSHSGAFDIINNRFEGLNLALNFTGSPIDGYIRGNLFTSVTTVFVGNLAHYLVFSMNSGFNTETWGNTTISSSTVVTFTHYLGYYGGQKLTPSFVSASFDSTSVAGWKWTATDTQITITVTPSGTYKVYWYAMWRVNSYP